ncbi:hypothetical protein B5M09_005788 [Aphanomyces astaci]|uniref:Uncharacterized protein n=1 Tax=Aphanomyces astaci TaxID=112090 RepID=A0A3R7Y577_APHAT|nr:hypothetical protein B5M09_005788 [Aphanomyces astaci]
MKDAVLIAAATAKLERATNEDIALDCANEATPGPAKTQMLADAAFADVALLQPSMIQYGRRDDGAPWSSLPRRYSTRKTRHHPAINYHEVPTTFAMYALTGVVYVTGALLGVTGLVIMYILVSCSHIESSNLLELNCVVGIVWIGRPLLRLRGVTSVCLLSTATVELRRDHQVAHFVVTDLVWHRPFSVPGKSLGWCTF